MCSPNLPFHAYATALLALCGSLSEQPKASAQSTTRVSVSSTGQQANDLSSYGSISADGRLVVFSSPATNLVLGDLNNTSDIFLHDRLTGQSTLVSLTSSAQQTIGGSNGSAISGDGQHVAFISGASNLYPGVTYGTYVRDFMTGLTTLVSRSSQGQPGSEVVLGFWYRPSISADGRYIAFESTATNLVIGDNNGVRDIFVHDRDADGNGIFDEPGGYSTVRVSVDSNGQQGNNESRFVHICASGRYVVYSSTASNLVANDTNSAEDVFLHDRDSDGNGIMDEPGGIQTTRVSVTSQGGESPPGDASLWPSVSADGRYIVFYGYARLVQGDTNGEVDVYLHDRVSHDTVRVSNRFNGAQTIAFSGPAQISSDGRFIAYYTLDSQVVPNDLNGGIDVVVYDRFTRVARLANINWVGQQAGGVGFSELVQRYGLAISNDGRYVTFRSDANDVVQNDTNGVPDIFVRDRGPKFAFDIDGDNVVAVNDLLAVINGWGPCPSQPNTCPADISGNGAVEIDDLLLVINNWG